MTGQQSLQFVEHLRRAGHLKLTDAGEAARTALPDQPQGELRRYLQSGSQAKLWEITDLSAAEFADQAARFYGYPRVTLQIWCENQDGRKTSAGTASAGQPSDLRSWINAGRKVAS